MAYTTIDDPELYFNTKLYTGTGSSGAKAITGVGFQPDWLWIKNRTVAQEHWLADSVRGTTKFLESNSSNAESSDGATGLASFDSDGFTLGTGSDRTNDLNESMVAWNWKETATAGFDIVAYNGTGSSQNISHSLSAAPTMMLIKNSTGTVRNWGVYHQGLASKSTDALYLDLNNVAATGGGGDWWNSTNPTSSVFSVGTRNEVNESGSTYIAYLFAEKKGYSKFGSYTGNGNADGTFVYTGFKPAFVIAKNTGASEGWSLFDNKRSTSGANLIDDFLVPSSSEAEISQNVCDFVSNGIKFRHVDGKYHNSGGSYIYMAFAESPFVNSNGVPNNAR